MNESQVEWFKAGSTLNRMKQLSRKFRPFSLNAAILYFTYTLCTSPRLNCHFWCSPRVISQPTSLLLYINEVTLSLNSHLILYADDI